RRAHDRHAASDQPRARDSEHAARGRDRHPGGGDRRDPARQAERLRRHDHCARRALRPAFLDRAALHRLVRRRPPLAAREQLRDGAPSDREPGAHADALHRALGGPRRGPDATDAVVDDDLARRRLCAYRARERAERAVGDLAARAPKQPDHRHDRDRAPARRPDLRGGDHRDDLRHRRLRRADRRSGEPARLHADPRRRARRRRRIRRREPRRRHRLLPPQPAHSRGGSALVSVVDATALTSPRARRRVLLRKRFLRRPMAVAGLVIVVVFVVVAALAPWVAPYSASATDFNAILAHSSSKHLLGTDELGRDELSRLIWGGRASMQAGFLATLLAMIVAVPIGMVAGYYRGWVDTAIARITDVLLAFPFLILAVGLAAILGPSLTNATLALGIASTPGLIRIARGEVLALREEDFVPAAVANGANDFTIIFRHILPNMTSTLLVQATLTIPGAIIGEAALS